MAKKKITKKAVKAVKKASKTPGGGIVIGLAVVVGIALVVCAFTVKLPIYDNQTFVEHWLSQQEEINNPSSNSSSSKPNSTASSRPSSSVSTIDFGGENYEDFQIHFLELGNWYTGDSIFIKAGNNDILIDAGSRYNSANAIESFVDQYCDDGKLEYVIATHAHEDHIAGFSGGASKNGIFYKYEIGTIIEFARTDKSTTVYSNYVEARDYAVSKGAKCYTALEAYNNPALRTISLGTDMSMSTLYQKYYENKASSENDYSVCNLFTYKNQHYLFTGDLESGGESSLVDSNDIPTCELYKAGHHGSKTSSSTKLMEVVKPKVVCVCACCGSDEYTDENNNQFPTQEFIDRVAPYTNNIYVTSISTDNSKRTFASMNGTICFSSNGSDFKVLCSNNNTILKETDWFKENRTWPSN